MLSAAGVTKGNGFSPNGLLVQCSIGLILGLSHIQFGGFMKLKSLILVAITAVPAWAVHAAGPELLAATETDGSSAALLLVGLGLMATIARRRFK